MTVRQIPQSMQKTYDKAMAPVEKVYDKAVDAARKARRGP